MKNRHCDLDEFHEEPESGHKHQPQIEEHHRSDLVVSVSSGHSSDVIKAIFSSFVYM